MATVIFPPCTLFETTGAVHFNTSGTPVGVVAGAGRTATGEVCAVADSGQARTFNGTFCLDVNGNTIYDASGAAVNVAAGFPLTANGSLCISNGTIVGVNQGWGFDASGRIVVTGAP